MTVTQTPALAARAPARSDIAIGLILGAAGVAVVAATAPEFVAVLAVPLLGAGVVAVIDQRTTRIATAHAALLAVVTVAACAIGIVTDRGSWASVIGGAALWAAPLFLLAVTGGFGGGDFKYAASLGALTGWVSLTVSLTGLLLAVIVAAVAAAAVAVRRRTTRAQVPLGIPLFAGSVGAVALQALAA